MPNPLLPVAVTVRLGAAERSAVAGSIRHSNAVLPTECSLSTTPPGPALAVAHVASMQTHAIATTVHDAPNRDTCSTLGGQLLGGGQLLLNQSQPGVPEARVGEVDADHRTQILRAA